ncbi:ribonuclease H11, partial [Selaginella moellendorffii]
HRVIGVDEAGRGPLAGPVVAAACIIPEDVDIQGIDDSKKLTAEKREQLYSQITSTPGVRFSICVVDAPRIDEINILQATMEAMETCVEELTGNGRDHPPYILIDGNRIPGGLSGKHARSVVKGDAESHVIAAASILAKVTRDRLMEDYDKRWPLYGFKDHKGYGTASHTAALLKHGPCDIHRRSFAPLRNLILDM